MSDQASDTGDVNPPLAEGSPGTSADRPLTDPDLDRLGYAPFAQALAKGIAEMRAPDGLVVALYGTWGLGKTTALNFVEHYLKEEAPDAFVVVRFNPWWFSGRVDIAAAFFDQMRAIFEKWETRGEQARKYAAELARVVGAVVPGGGGAGDAAGNLIAGAPADVPELKTKLAEAIAGQEKRLLILIDDIDRLTEDEVAELFGVVKGLADFPQTIYLLAFDRRQVARALSRRTAQEGFDYLEKIVQVPFELPLPEQEALQAVLLDHLGEIVGEVEEDLLDPEQLNALLTNGLDGLMKTPRDIVRLTNSLRVTYGAVRGEVNVVDFIGIEALRVFEPAVYDRIRTRPEMFGVLTGIARAFPQAREDDRRSFHTGWIDAIEDLHQREAVKKIVARLFPEMEKIFDVLIGVGRRRIDNLRGRSIAAPEYFRLYFRFALGDEALSRELVAALLAAAADPEDFARQLLALAEEKTRSGRTQASVMLDELNAQAEHGFRAEDAAGVIKSLTDIGDELWIEGDDEFLGVDNPTRLTWLIGALLDRVPTDERCEVLKDALRDAESIGTPTLLVRRLVRSLGVPTESSTQATPPEQLDERSALISIDCGKELEQLAASRIADATAAGRLWTLPRLLWVLAEWKRWGKPEALQAWVDGVLADDGQLAQLLVGARSQHVSIRGMRFRLDPRSLDDFAARQDVAEAIRRLKKTDPGGDVGDSCDQYLLELEMLEQNKDPDSRFSW